MFKHLVLTICTLLPATASAETLLKGKIGALDYVIEGVQYEASGLILSDGRRTDLYSETASVTQDISFVFGSKGHGTVFWVSAGGGAEIPTPIIVLVPARVSENIIKDNTNLATYQSDKIVDYYEMIDGSTHLNFGKSYDVNSPFSFSLEIDPTGNIIKSNMWFDPEANIPN